MDACVSESSNKPTDFKAKKEKPKSKKKVKYFSEAPELSAIFYKGPDQKLTSASKVRTFSGTSFRQSAQMKSSSLGVMKTLGGWIVATTLPVV